MARKSIGYAKLIWTCPNCLTKNPGPIKTCISCGSPQPVDVKFEQPISQTILAEELEITDAKKGPDKHCAFCGARNPAGAEICSQCGADLVHGKKRLAGHVIGAFQNKKAADIKCPNCHTLNAPDSSKCSTCGAPLSQAKPASEKITPLGVQASKKTLSPLARIIFIGLSLIFCIVIVSVTIGLFKKEQITGTVENVSWTITIPIEEYKFTQKEDWLSNIPNDVNLDFCESRYHHTQSEPAPNAEEICGTPYTVDQGSGYAEVVQDCQYRIFLDYCNYTIEDWVAVDQYIMSGVDHIISTPDIKLSSNQIAGEQEEIYTIFFSTPEGLLKFSTDDRSLFYQCQIGSEWTLEVNNYNSITAIY